MLTNILRQRTQDPEIKRCAIDYMERMGSFEYSRRVLELLERKAMDEVARLERVWGADGAEMVGRLLGRLKSL